MNSQFPVPTTGTSRALDNEGETVQSSLLFRLAQIGLTVFLKNYVAICGQWTVNDTIYTYMMFNTHCFHLLKNAIAGSKRQYWECRLSVISLTAFQLLTDHNYLLVLPHSTLVCVCPFHSAKILEENSEKV